MGVLEPEVVAAIDDLGLAARRVVEGLRAGEHRSPFHGFNHEFSQYREYRPGDDLKYLDWKALGRTDRLYTRLFLETTNMAVVFVVDASASMGFPVAGDSSGAPAGGSAGVSKLRYASVMTAALAHLLIGSGDAAGLLALSDRNTTWLPARGGRAHLQHLLQRLARLEPGGAWQPQRALRRAAELLRRRGLLVVLSDFYDDEDATFAELKRCAARGHEVAMLHVLSRPELELPYDGPLEFTDMEGNARRLTEPAKVRDAYRERIAAFCEGWRQRATAAGIDYQRLVTDEPPSTALRQYLVRREIAAGHTHTHPHRKR
jgi:uncharacterized protein (DUF58 family)